jgi:cell division septal protein FtsQ
VASELSGKWLGIIPKNNILFMGKAAIGNAISKSFPDVASVKTTLAGLGSLTVEVTERSPYGKWCVIADPNNNCLMIDDQGLAFEKFDQSMQSSATTSTSTAILIVFTSAEPKLDTNIFNKTRFEKLKQFIQSFKSAGFVIDSVKEQDADYFFTLDNGAEIRLQGTDDPEDIASKLFSVEADLQKQADAGRVDYIDLRYGNKVYLKMK